MVFASAAKQQLRASVLTACYSVHSLELQGVFASQRMYSHADDGSACAGNSRIIWMHFATSGALSAPVFVSLPAQSVADCTLANCAVPVFPQQQMLILIAVFCMWTQHLLRSAAAWLALYLLPCQNCCCVMYQPGLGHAPCLDLFMPWAAYLLIVCLSVPVRQA